MLRGTAWHTVGLYWVPGHAGMRGNEIADKLIRDGSVQQFVGPEPFLGVSKQNIRRKIKRWMENQHLVLWRGPCGTQRQAQELLALTWLQGPNYCPLIGHNPGLLLASLLDITPWEDIYIMGLSNNPTCRKCGNEEANPVPHFVWVWGLCFTQTYIPGFLLFGPWGYQETKCRGHLELC
jgi:hypothetical protein